VPAWVMLPVVLQSWLAASIRIFISPSVLDTIKKETIF
jgi:hypothetical protein